jgi:hypothetical protein
MSVAQKTRYVGRSWVLMAFVSALRRRGFSVAGVPAAVGRMSPWAG